VLTASTVVADSPNRGDDQEPAPSERHDYRQVVHNDSLPDVHWEINTKGSERSEDVVFVGFVALIRSVYNKAKNTPY
jgi:hypothetical protein